MTDRRRRKGKKTAGEFFAKLKELAKGHKKASLPILILLLAGILALLLWGLSSVIMSQVNVGKIVIKGEHPYTYEEIIAAGEVNVGERLRDVDTDEVGNNILMRLPYIYEIKVRKTFPNRVKITVRCRDAGFFVKLSGRYYALSEEFTVLEESKDKELFVRNGVMEIALPGVYSAVLSEKLGFEPQDDDDGYIFKIIERLLSSELPGRITKIDISDKFNIAVTVGTNRLIRFGSVSDIDVKLDALKQVLSDPMFERQAYFIIDAVNPKHVSAREVGEKEFLSENE